MKEVGLQQVYDTVGQALNRQDYQTMGAVLLPAIDQFHDDPHLHHFASHYYTVNNNLSTALLHALKANELEPTGANYTNLGSIYRRMNMPQEAYRALEEAVGYEPKNKHPWNNLGAAYCNEGDPDPGIAACDEALRLDPDFDKARWNRGLLLLEKGEFAKGFDDYRAGLSIGERLVKTYAEDPDAEPVFVDDVEVLRKWARKNNKKPRIIIWGEQGLGDEIMFSTCLPDLSADAEIVYDCHPRMHEVLERSYSDVVDAIYPTRKDKGAEWYAGIEPCQFKCSIGDLPRWYRRDLGAFHAAREAEGPWLVPDMEMSAKYRTELLRLSEGKKLVGFAWTGGIINTQRWYRSCQLPELNPMTMHPDVQPVSLQYEDDVAAIQDIYEATNKLVYRFPAVTQHFDYDHTLNMVCALDAVVTVCQSVAHLAAAAGIKTFVLVPDKPAWRYGLEGDDWFWYEDAKLYRREGSTWNSAIQACQKDLFNYLGVENE